MVSDDIDDEMEAPDEPAGRRGSEREARGRGSEAARQRGSGVERQRGRGVEGRRCSGGGKGDNAANRGVSRHAGGRQNTLVANDLVLKQRGGAKEDLSSGQGMNTRWALVFSHFGPQKTHLLGGQTFARPRGLRHRQKFFRDHAATVVAPKR